MQIEPEEFRRRYAELSDEALISIDRKDLTEVAQGYFDAELAQRGLNAPQPSPGSDRNSEANPEMNLVPVETFLSVADGELGRDLLRAADIPAYLENELSSNWTGAGGLRLMVPASFLEEAKEILEAGISDEDLIAQAEAAEPIDPDQAGG